MSGADPGWICAGVFYNFTKWTLTVWENQKDEKENQMNDVGNCLILWASF